MNLLAVLVLAAPGTIRVDVEGGATEVVALESGVERARAAVADGRAELGPLPDGAYDVFARGPAAVSALERGVVPAADGGGADVRLVAAPAFAVAVEGATPDTTVWADGRPFPAAALRLPAGLHRCTATAPGRAPSPPRLVRVDGETAATLAVALEPGLVVLGTVTGAERPEVQLFVDGYPRGDTVFPGADGRFGCAGARGRVVSVRVRAPGRAEALRRVSFYPGETRARVRIALEPGSAAVLPVRDAAGEPVPGAVARLLPAWLDRVLEEPRLRANALPERRAIDGDATFTTLAAGASYRVLVEAPGFVPASSPAFEAPAAGDVRTLAPLVLARGAVVRGRVTGLDAPAGARVVCVGESSTRVRRTDRAGRFRFDGLDGGAYALYVRDVDEKPRPVDVESGGETVVEVAVAARDPERVVRGTVLDAAGRPLGGVRVEAAGIAAVTGDDGGFVLRGMPRGRPRVAVACTPVPGSRAFGEDPHLPWREDKAPVGADLRLRLPRAAELRLQFEGPVRRLARATLHVAAGDGVRVRWPVPRGAGRIAVPDLPAGPCTVELEAPGLLGVDAGLLVAAPAPAPAAMVRLLQGRTATGRVVVRSALRMPGAAPRFADAPVEEGWVTLVDGAAHRALATAPVQPDGTFRLSGLPPGRVLLVAAAPGRAPVAEAVDLAGADAADLTFVLGAASRAVFAVKGDRERPVPGAVVRLRTTHGVDVRDLAAVGRFRGFVADARDGADLAPLFAWKQDGNGRVSTPLLAPASYDVVVVAPGFEPAKTGVRVRPRWVQQEIREVQEFFPNSRGEHVTVVRLVPRKADNEGNGD